eukprot:CAMPEP_0171991050 /NCGR_PEP_ID=MMETSP0993-20121228/277234_1 /TAXON_ID=483369 /ORGANISM="non described non described, Strain CCMP2098" /LENGTH=311 /DNA_ID=CAMNT_0012644069 /DNA_START=149 /DNA_END=1081 /DNA_ORIENTATION=-
MKEGGADSAERVNNNWAQVVDKVISQKSWGELEDNIRSIEADVENNLKAERSQGGIVGRVRLLLLQEELGDALALASPSLLQATRKSLLTLLDGLAEWFVVAFGVAVCAASAMAWLLPPEAAVCAASAMAWLLHTRSGRAVVATAASSALLAKAFSMARASGILVDLPPSVEAGVEALLSAAATATAHAIRLCSHFNADLGFVLELGKGVAEAVGLGSLALLAVPRLAAIVAGAGYEKRGAKKAVAAAAAQQQQESRAAAKVKKYGGRGGNDKAEAVAKVKGGAAKRVSSGDVGYEKSSCKASAEAAAAAA